MGGRGGGAELDGSPWRAAGSLCEFARGSRLAVSSTCVIGAEQLNPQTFWRLLQVRLKDLGRKWSLQADLRGRAAGGSGPATSCMH